MLLRRYANRQAVKPQPEKKAETKTEEQKPVKKSTKKQEGEY